MSNPQPPEPRTTRPAGPVPEDNQPGHHPPEEQDKPELDAFAHRLGIPDEHGEVPAAAATPEDNEPSPAPDPPKMAAAIGAAVVAVILGLLAIRRLRRHSRDR